MHPNPSSPTHRSSPALRLLLPVVVLLCPPSPPASSAAANTLLSPVPRRDRATHGWTRQGPLGTPVGRASPETPYGAGKSPLTPPLASALFEREVGDEPDRWAPRVSDPAAGARCLSGDGPGKMCLRRRLSSAWPSHWAGPRSICRPVHMIRLKPYFLFLFPVNFKNP